MEKYKQAEQIRALSHCDKTSYENMIVLQGLEDYVGA